MTNVGVHAQNLLKAKTGAKCVQPMAFKLGHYQSVLTLMFTCVVNQPKTALRYITISNADSR